MASIGKAFKREMVAYALALPALSTAIGDRLWAIRASQNSQTPYVVWTTVSSIQGYSHQGSTGLEETRVQFSIFADTAAKCEEIRDLIKDRFEGMKGLLTSGVRVESCFFDNEFDLSADGMPNLRQKTIQFRFTIKAVS